MLKILCEDKNLTSLAAAFQGEYSADCDLSAEVVFVDEEEIKRINAQARNTPKVTDVLSFPSLEGIRGKTIKLSEHAADGDGEGGIFIGSIAVCEKRAKEQAEEYGHSYEREIFYLITHGLFHLLGYDHMTDGDKAEMRQREESVMSKLSLPREE